MSTAHTTTPISETPSSAVFILPDQAWSRRVSGVFSNELTNQHPWRAHAVLTEKVNGNFLVSVRAPLENRHGAADLCQKFPTGGGREAAAVINDLPHKMLASFMDEFNGHFSRR